MAVPLSPYAASTQVAVLLPNLLKDALDFSPGTRPTKAAVDMMINWVSSHIDSQFRQAGYVIPFTALPGETWPEDQTAYIHLIAVMGVAAYASGKALKPAPAAGPGRQGSADNTWQLMYSEEMSRIYDVRTRTTGLRFRSSYYTGTPAEQALVEPLGATSDFLEEGFDPTRQLNLWEMTEKVHAIETSMKGMDIAWDYLFGLFSLNRGYGRSTLE